MTRESNVFRFPFLLKTRTMYQIDVIAEALNDLLGFRQNPDPSGPQLTPDLLISESYMYFEDEHPLVTITNLWKISQEFIATVYPDYVPGDTYTEGTIVAFNSKDWIALRDNQNIEPGTSALDWAEYSAFSVWLSQLRRTAIIKVIEQFVRTKQTLKKGKAILDKKALYNGVGRMSNQIDNNDQFVGLDIELPRHQGATCYINKAGFQFTEAVTFDLHLFHSSQEDPIRTISIEYTKANSVQWFNLADLILKYYDEDITDTGGAYSIGYYQIDLGTAKAINKVIDWSTGPCSACEEYMFNDYQLRSKYLSVFAMAAPEGTKGKLFPSEDKSFYSDRNYGMNLQVSVLCDFTDFVIEQKDIFKAAISKQFAILTLEKMIHNPEGNITREVLTKNAARITYDLDGTDESKDNSLRAKFVEEMEAIDFSTEGINRLCLKCSNKGIRYKSI